LVVVLGHGCCFLVSWLVVKMVDDRWLAWLTSLFLECGFIELSCVER
jgi:hypothetical protein